MNDIERTYDEFGDILDDLVLYVVTDGDLCGSGYDEKRLALFRAARAAFGPRDATPREPFGLLTVSALDGRYQP